MKIAEKKNLFLMLLGAVAILLAAFFIFQQMHSKADLDSVNTALAQLEQENSYRFNSVAKVTAEDKQREYYLLNGEISGQNRHIVGQVLGTNLEIYYIDGNFWQKSGSDGAFRQIDAGELEQALAFAAELEPAAMLDFDQVQGWNFEGTEEVNGMVCRKVSITQAQAGGWIGQYFDQVSYVFWLERGADRICQATVQATSYSGNIGLSVSLCFSDYDKTISIAPPQ